MNVRNAKEIARFDADYVGMSQTSSFLNFSQYEDYYDGIKDLNNRVIRVVNQETFQEDPLRVLRLAQFVSRFEFDIDCYSQQLCFEMVQRGDLKLEIPSQSNKTTFDDIEDPLPPARSSGCDSAAGGRDRRSWSPPRSWRPGSYSPSARSNAFCPESAGGRPR